MATEGLPDWAALFADLLAEGRSPNAEEVIAAVMDAERRAARARREGRRSDFLRFWEHEVFESLEGTVARVQAALGNEHRADEPAWRVFRIEWLDSARVIERRWLQDLRDPTRVRSEERRRLTTKARAPRLKRAKMSPRRATVRRR